MKAVITLSFPKHHETITTFLPFLTPTYPPITVGPGSHRQRATRVGSKVPYIVLHTVPSDFIRKGQICCSAVGHNESRGYEIHGSCATLTQSVNERPPPQSDRYRGSVLRCRQLGLPGNTLWLVFKTPNICSFRRSKVIRNFRSRIDAVWSSNLGV